MTLASNSSETFTPTDLYGGEADVVTDAYTVASGNNVAKHEVLARTAADNKMVKWDPAGTGGAETAVGIAAEAIDASAADVEGPVYIGGFFNIDEVVAPNATAAEIERAFDGSNIALRKPRYSGA